MRDIIRDFLFDTIQRHLITHARIAESGWESASADEDTITGHLGATLQARGSHLVRLNGERWRWRVRYKKFQGRGRGAFEHVSGAGGIIQVKVGLPEADASSVVSKGMLFQAKKNNIRRDRRLVEQIQRMEAFGEGCSAVFEYRSDGFGAIGGGTLLERLTGAAPVGREGLQSLGEFLGSVFLQCDVGIRGMYYDGVRARLLVPTRLGEVREFRVKLRHRIAIELERGA